jgi:hypothetical protein
MEKKSSGRLTVLSEPPGLKITLDGNGMEKTPASLVEVDAGIHALHVKNSKIQIYIELGKTLKISLYTYTDTRPLGAFQEFTEAARNIFNLIDQ